MRNFCKKIVCIGTTGSGKTTFCSKLSNLLKIPHIELDSLNWGPNWTPSEDLPSKILSAIDSLPEWIVDGNNESTRDLVWSRANTVIWLNYPLWIVFLRVLKRTMERLLLQKELWNGNRERWRVVFSCNSILIWCVIMHYRYKTEFPACMKKHLHLNVITLKSPSETDMWLEQVANSPLELDQLPTER